LEKELKQASLSVFVDSSDSTPGAKFYHGEMKGVPIRIEVGEREADSDSVSVVTRVELDGQRKFSLRRENLTGTIQKILEDFSDALWNRAKRRLDTAIRDGDKFDSVVKLIEDQNSVFRLGWCGSEDCEKKISETKASVRCIIGADELDRECAVCNRKSSLVILVAKAY